MLEQIHNALYWATRQTFTVKVTVYHPACKPFMLQWIPEQDSCSNTGGAQEKQVRTGLQCWPPDVSSRERSQVWCLGGPMFDVHGDLGAGGRSQVCYLGDVRVPTSQSIIHNRSHGDPLNRMADRHLWKHWPSQQLRLKGSNYSKYLTISISGYMVWHLTQISFTVMHHLKLTGLILRVVKEAQCFFI